MKLHQLKENFNNLNRTKQLEFMRMYTDKREKAISSQVIIKMKKENKKPGVSKGKKSLVKVTDEQFDLLKALGLI